MITIDASKDPKAGFGGGTTLVTPQNQQQPVGSKKEVTEN